MLAVPSPTRVHEEEPERDTDQLVSNGSSFAKSCCDLHGSINPVSNVRQQFRRTRDGGNFDFPLSEDPTAVRDINHIPWVCKAFKIAWRYMVGGRNGIVDLTAARIRDRLPTWLGISHPEVPLLEIKKFTLAWINQENTGRTEKIPEFER